MKMYGKKEVQLQVTSLTYRSFATTLSQLKLCDFSGETFNGFEVL
jgi:hypothetical protein